MFQAEEAIVITIHLRVELMPGLRRVGDKSFLDLKLPDAATVKTMLAKLDFKDDEMTHLRIFVNNKLERLEKNLNDGDNVWVGFVIGGG